MIPRIIHQIWEGRTERLDDEYKVLASTWKEHHPTWKYEFWDRNRLEDFVYNNYPEMIDIYFGYPYSAQRWNVIRYLILYKMGGLYADFDYECLESFEKHIGDESKCYFALEPEQHCRSFSKNIFFNNALMASPPHHLFFSYVIAFLQIIPITYKDGKYLDVLNSTGKLMLTNLYEDYSDKNKIGFFTAEQVSPFSKNEIQDYIHGKANEEILEMKLQKAIAVHYFWGSWIYKQDTYTSPKHRLTCMHISDLYQIFRQYPVICLLPQDCSPDSLFFVVRSLTYDIDKSAQEALNAGCRYVIVDDPTVITDNRYILVDDTHQTLQQLANHHHQILKTPVIGITGTCGKTTTTELLSIVLSSKYKVVYTQENDNSSLGVISTLLRLTPEHEMAIIEMGAGGPGGIRELAQIARPNYGIVTNVGLAHLDGFGSLEGVIRTKGELYDYLRRSDGKIFIHNENMYLKPMAEGLEQISYGESKDAFVSGQLVNSDPCLCFEWENAGERHVVSTHLAGDYNLFNALAAITVGLYFDVSASEINRTISEYVPTNYRSQWKRTIYNELLIDCFNANPCSMQAALANFAKLTATPKAVILGDMHELGVNSAKLYAEIIETLNEFRFEKVLLCGDKFTAIYSNYQCFPDIKALYCHLSENQLQGYHILLKGGIKMDMNIIIDLL
ncbi:MAG: UDP-N-acetylmuramoyl-tripeptide--D-alanyl-D-alanine ligase [Tannerella sp.]|jgi:UDP-N-acetylmuramoyl-tripeptide--D-alanyl-D-alanine ligase|nr:UDP-N-acetylmuramoyl-tripeptide--D-alanyl-D-alanine ligase [Tannerella sp.]